MWIVLSDAFLSVVADKDEPSGPRLLVPARRQGDIERVFPEAEFGMELQTREALGPHRSG
jgi:hypothetical protein